MKNLVVLSGAGMSAESGLKTFRDADGLWENHRVEDVATPEAWQRNPLLVLEFYNQRRKQLLECGPNAGHRGLVELEKHFHVSIVTQNVDDLHERAGSKHVLHLHGELKKARSTVNPSLVYELEGWQLNWGDKCEKGSQLRPHIVWFGEAVPAIEDAAYIVGQADILVIIGTSLNVYPAAGLIHYAQSHVPVYVIDPGAPNFFPGPHIEHIRKGASEGVAALIEKLTQ
ncbi:MAG: NAD-dependent deacylase [Breznakibacter sp.]